MKARVGINGFGRVGRRAFRVPPERYPNHLELVAVNDIADLTHCLTKKGI
jgi:glyceraldehyde 3-phosphate dehydrogenase